MVAVSAFIVVLLAACTPGETPPLTQQSADETNTDTDEPDYCERLSVYAAALRDASATNESHGTAAVEQQVSNLVAATQEATAVSPSEVAEAWGHALAFYAAFADRHRAADWVLRDVTAADFPDQSYIESAEQAIADDGEVRCGIDVAAIANSSAKHDHDLRHCAEPPELDEIDGLVDVGLMLPVQREEFDLQRLEYLDRYYASTSVTPLEDDYTTDDQGVRVYERDGETYHHPVVLAQRAIRMVNAYIMTEDRPFLDSAIAHAHRLEEVHVEVNGAWFFSYDFDYRLGRTLGLHVTAPWYSSMAQGQALTAFARLYEVTGDQRWRTAAEATFSSLMILCHEVPAETPWVSYVDNGGYLWLEEYATNIPSHVLNGYIYTLIGMYDWWLVDDTEATRAPLEAGLTTMRDHVADFRNPGTMSSYYHWYGAGGVKYHRGHVLQLRWLEEATLERTFGQVAETFNEDSPI